LLAEPTVPVVGRAPHPLTEVPPCRLDGLLSRNLNSRRNLTDEFNVSW